MRRYIYLLLFVLSVCGGMVTSCSRHEVRFRIGVSQCSDDEWRHQMNNEMLREALFYDGVEVEIRTVKDDNARQAEDIRHFIEAGVDLLIVAPNEAEPITPVVEEAYDRGIPVIVVDRRILSEKYTAYVGADNYEIGKAIGRYVPRGNVYTISWLPDYDSEQHPANVGCVEVVRMGGGVTAQILYADNLKMYIRTILGTEEARWTAWTQV